MSTLERSRQNLTLPSLLENLALLSLPKKFFMKKNKIEKIGKIQKRLDDKWRDYVLAKNDYVCFSCAGIAGVAHHFIFKSQSKRLRFEEINLIPLCNDCHRKIHLFKSVHAPLVIGKIIRRLGQDWFSQIEKLKDEKLESSSWTKTYLYKKEEEIDELANLDYS